MLMHHVTFDPRKTVLVSLIGVGGTGSMLLTHLVRLNQAVRALGGAGLHVQAYDPDDVSDHNLTRQNFAPADVGRNKAVVLVERCNLYAGLNWRAYPRTYEPSDHNKSVHLVISCVDSGSARHEIYESFAHQPPPYWLDCGNEARSGQVILGRFDRTLPHILELDPTGMKGDEASGPSCSALEALTRQHLMINPNVALQAAGMLSDLLLLGCIETSAVYLRLDGNLRALAQPLVHSNKRTFEGLIPQTQRPSRPAKRAKRAA